MIRLEDTAFTNKDLGAGALVELDSYTVVRDCKLSITVRFTALDGGGDEYSVTVTRQESGGSEYKYFGTQFSVADAAAGLYVPSIDIPVEAGDVVRVKARNMTDAGDAAVAGQVEWVDTDAPSRPYGHLYVDATGGNDAYDGSKFYPLATVQAAVDAAAGGETINIGPGTYSERVQAQAKAGLTFQGAGPSTVLTWATAGQPTLQVASWTTIRNLRIANTAAATARALDVSDTVDVMVDRVVLESTGYGLRAVGVVGLHVRDNFIAAQECGIMVSPPATSKRTTPVMILETSQIYLQDWTTCSAWGVFMATQGADSHGMVLIKGCTIGAQTAADDAQDNGQAIATLVGIPGGVIRAEIVDSILIGVGDNACGAKTVGTGEQLEVYLTGAKCIRQ